MLSEAAWLHTAVSKLGLHIHIWIFCRCIPTAFPECALTSVTVDVESFYARGLGWSHGAIVWFFFSLRGWSDHLITAPPPRCSESVASVGPASGPLTRASRSASQIYSTVWFHQMWLYLWMGSVWHERQICKEISRLPWHNGGRLSRNSCASLCFITSRLGPVLQLWPSPDLSGNSQTLAAAWRMSRKRDSPDVPSPNREPEISWNAWKQMSGIAHGPSQTGGICLWHVC